MTSSGTGGAKIALGCVADDFTGATDLCNTLVRQGMRTVQLIDVPADDMAVPDVDAVTVALKTRTCPVGEAVDRSLAAMAWLRRAGAEQLFFKYCSTFDSTAAGNIGPVADAMLAALDADFTIACPAFPETGRTIYQGHLFVGETLLSDTHMRHHPLTPMTDSSLVRVLQSQTTHQVGLIAYATVRQGAAAIRERMARLRATHRYAIVDAVTDEDLIAIGEACSDLKLVTGGSGVSMGLPANFRAKGKLGGDGAADRLPAVAGPELVLAGSCSAATLAQIAAFQEKRPAFRLSPVEPGRNAAAAITWAEAELGRGPILVYASAPPEEVRAMQERFGREKAGAMIEEALATVAKALVAKGARRLVVAGGETSGAVVQALGIKGLQIGAQIDPGVPATVTLGGAAPLALALKSGNFGGRDFLTKAFEVMP